MQFPQLSDGVIDALLLRARRVCVGGADDLIRAFVSFIEAELQAKLHRDGAGHHIAPLNWPVVHALKLQALATPVKRIDDRPLDVARALVRLVELEHEMRLERASDHELA